MGSRQVEKTPVRLSPSSSTTRGGMLSTDGLAVPLLADGRSPSAQQIFFAAALALFGIRCSTDKIGLSQTLGHVEVAI